MTDFPAFPSIGAPHSIEPHPTECRNCRFVFSINDTRRVKPGYRYCTKCFEKMESIGQVVKNYRYEDGQYTLMWEGDPFHADRNLTDKMFSKNPKFKF